MKKVNFVRFFKNILPATFENTLTYIEQLRAIKDKQDEIIDVINESAIVESGDGVEIVDGVLKAKVDGTSIKFNEDGEMYAEGGGGGGQSYTAGDGISIENNEISCDETIARTDDLPTKTSDLRNDSGFITQNDIPSIPSKTSDLQNDSGFITEEDLPDIPTYTGGQGVAITDATGGGKQVSAKVDGTSITFDADGNLKAVGGGGGGAVDSVNGKTGDVVLKAEDIEVSNSQSVQDNLERIDESLEGVIDDVQALEDGKEDAFLKGVGLGVQEAAAGKTLYVKIDGQTIQTDPQGNLKAVGGSGGSYTAGDGIEITAANQIKTKVESASLDYNNVGELRLALAAGVGLIFGTTAVGKKSLGINMDYGVFIVNSQGKFTINWDSPIVIAKIQEIAGQIASGGITDRLSSSVNNSENSPLSDTVNPSDDVLINVHN